MHFFEHPLIRPGALQYRTYQINIAKAALTANTLVVLPTGLGKTAIALITSAYVLEDPDAKILMLAPTRPLALQHYETFKKTLSIPSDEIVLLTGQTPKSQRALLWQNARVISATPQTVLSEMSNLNLGDVALLIVDECHRSVNRYAYVDVVKAYFKQRPKPLVMGLTASPSSEKIKTICTNLSISRIEARSEDDPDVAPYVKSRIVEHIRIELPPELEAVRAALKEFVRKKIAALKEKNIIRTSRPRKRDIIAIQNHAIKNHIYGIVMLTAPLLRAAHALELIESQSVAALHDYFEQIQKQKSKVARVLLSDPAIRRAITLLKKVHIEHPKMHKLIEIIKEQLVSNPKAKIIVFSNYRTQAARITQRLNAEGIRAARFVGQASRGGDVGLKQSQQAEIIRRFADGDFNVLVCTSVGEEGLDIPEVDLVIFYEPVPSEIRKIQREGRTARHKAGRVVVLMTRGTSDESYYWVARYKEQKLKRMLKSMGGQNRKQRCLYEWY